MPRPYAALCRVAATAIRLHPRREPGIYAAPMIDCRKAVKRIECSAQMRRLKRPEGRPLAKTGTAVEVSRGLDLATAIEKSRFESEDAPLE